MTAFTASPTAQAGPGELSTRQAEALLRLTESAPGIGNRPQFFVWSQGPLHTLLPHRVLVCGSWQRLRRAMEFSVFHSVVVSPPALGWLGRADSALMRALVDRWVQAPRALSVVSEQLDGEAGEQSRSLLAELGCGTWLVHGVARPQRPHEVESLFVVAGEPSQTRESGACRLLDMALPCLHTTWRRVHSVDLGVSAARVSAATDTPPTSAAPLRVLLTDREREILSLAQGGCTNAVIGGRLNISPLTVKNHIQKILRKFKARNRAQAVALAMGSGLLGDGQ
jgi:transcriptional regulator EpsA